MTEDQSADPMAAFDAGMVVFGAPGRYIQGEGVLSRVGDCAVQIGSAALLIADSGVLALVETAIRRSCARVGVRLRVIGFDGRLGLSTAGELAANIEGISPHTIVAAGGGRAIDAGKALADVTGLNLITVPTVASNDAPTSKNYVLYDDAGHLLEVRHLRRSPDFVIVDTRLLAGAPKRMFAAGLGDALSKKAEALACAAGTGTSMFSARPPRLATAAAVLCHDLLLTHGRSAYDVAGSGTPTPDFEVAVEAMILMAGLGFESGGLSVPHALTRGLSRLPGAGSAPHGFQVAYGLAVHQKLLDEPMGASLLDLYRHVGLPLSLHELTGHPVSAAQIAEVATAALPVRHMLNFPRPLSLEALTSAMEAVEDEVCHLAGRREPEGCRVEA